MWINLRILSVSWWCCAIISVFTQEVVTSSLIFVIEFAEFSESYFGNLIVWYFNVKFTETPTAMALKINAFVIMSTMKDFPHKRNVTTKEYYHLVLSKNQTARLSVWWCKSQPDNIAMVLVIRFVLKWKRLATRFFFLHFLQHANYLYKCTTNRSNPSF